MRLRRFLHIAFIGTVLTSLNLLAADAPLASASPEAKESFAKIKDAVLKEAALPPLILADNDEVYFWLMGDRLDSLVKAYFYSHDPAFLDAYVPLQQQVIGQRYIHPSKPEWDGWFNYKNGIDTPHGLAELDHESLVYYVPVLRFIQEVRKDPALKEKYGKLADAWLVDVQRSLWAWDKRGCWHELGDKVGWYSFPAQYPDPKTGDMVNVIGINAGATVPYNKVHQLDVALSMAYQITGDAAYKDRMTETANYFKSHWRTDDKHVEWNYRDHAFPADFASGVVGQGPPKTGEFVHPHPSYYRLDSSDIVLLYNEGIVFTKDDINKLLQTNLEFMFMGDEKAPKYKMINGTYEAPGKYKKGTLWPALAQFSDKVRQLWKTEIDNSHDWGSDSALDYLIATSQPVSFDQRLMKPGAPQP